MNRHLSTAGPLQATNPEHGAFPSVHRVLGNRIMQVLWHGSCHLHTLCCGCCCALYPPHSKKPPAFLKKWATFLFIASPSKACGEPLRPEFLSSTNADIAQLHRELLCPRGLVPKKFLPSTQAFFIITPQPKPSVLASPPSDLDKKAGGCRRTSRQRSAWRGPDAGKSHPAAPAESRLASLGADTQTCKRRDENKIL